MLRDIFLNARECVSAPGRKLADANHWLLSTVNAVTLRHKGESMLQDVRYGIRTLLKRPGFTVISILTLALGIGATTAVFSLIQGVLLSPPPYKHPEQLVLIPSARVDRQEMSGARAWPALQW